MWKNLNIEEGSDLLHQSTFYFGFYCSNPHKTIALAFFFECGIVETGDLPLSSFS